MTNVQLERLANTALAVALLAGYVALTIAGKDANALLLLLGGQGATLGVSKLASTVSS